MANALSLASQGEILSPMTRNMLAKLARRGQIQEAIDVGMGRKPAAIAYGEEGLQAPAVAGGLVSLDPTDYLSGAGLAKLAAMAKVGGAGVSTLLGSRLLANKLGAGEVPSMFRQSGMFAGKGAKTANLVMLDKAQEMAKAGIPDAEIWRQTGWALNTPDKIPRFEIPDDAAKWERNLPFEARVEPMSNTISHAQLYDAYPETGNITTVFGQNVNAEGGIGSYHFDPSLRRGIINIESGGSNAIQNAKSTGLHELQHAIQEREGFASGGDPEYQIQKLLNEDKELRRLVTQAGMSKDAAIRYLGGAQKYRDAGYENYNRLAGEAEARLTESRMNMTPAQRLAQYPYDPAYFEQATGVPLNSLIVRKEGGTAMSLPQDNAMTRLIREAQDQIDAENAAKNAIRYTTQDNRARNALVGIGAGGSGVAGGYYGADYLAK